LQRVSFAVVHFNNGLHGWGYTERQFKSGFPIFLEAIRALPGHARLIWTTITPVKPEASNGATNPRIDSRNAIAQALVEPEKILIDDLHALMSQHSDLYEDPFHFNKVGAAIMGDQAATIIRRALENSGHERPGQH
jgi:lysophospholipase L1-like esterase